MGKKIQVVYRDVDRTPLLYVIREMAAAYENLEIAIEQVADGEEYEEGFLRGDFDLICEHIRFLFPARLAGHPIRCLAACQNRSTEQLLARGPIATVADLHGKTVAIRGTPSSRISATQWLKHLDLAERANILIAEDDEVGRWQQWRKVVSGEAEAVICSPLYVDAAIGHGLHVIGASPLPEIGSLFFAALGPFVLQREADLAHFMRALYRALHTFHKDPERTIEIMAGEPARLMGLTDGQALHRQYERLRSGYSIRPIPEVEAIRNTCEMIGDNYANLEGLNPLMMWDTQFLVALEEEHFGERLDAAIAESANR